MVPFLCLIAIVVFFVRPDLGLGIAGAVIAVVSGIGLFVYIGLMLGSEPAWVRENAPLIPVDELPDHIKYHGVIVKDFWQSPGDIEYADAILKFTPVVGKAYNAKLSDVKSVRFTTGLNGKVRLNRFGVNLRIKNSGSIGFTLENVEPWRSILLHHVKLDSKSTNS
jgi:hypothetical protein